MRLEVDWTRCDGHGTCALLLPGNIRPDADGFPVVTEALVDVREMHHARRAVATCPALALRLARP